jgi:hypothetical protein
MKLSLSVGLWLLSLLAASNAFSSKSAGFQLAASRTRQQWQQRPPPFIRTCVWSTSKPTTPTTQEASKPNTTSNTNTNATADDEDHHNDAVSKFSKVKWKKKRYLMMHDVKQFIRQGSRHAPRKAQEMVRRMLTLYEKSGYDDDYKPKRQAYNLWIHALATTRSSSSSSNNNNNNNNNNTLLEEEENAGDLAEQVLEEMQAAGVQPDIVTYTSVMDAHAKSKSPQKEEQVLYQLLDQAAAAATATNCCSNKDDDHHHLGVSGAVTCDTILNAWAQQGTKEGAQRAQTILQKLEMWQQKDIRPTKFSYATGTSLFIYLYIYYCICLVCVFVCLFAVRVDIHLLLFVDNSHQCLVQGWHWRCCYAGRGALAANVAA